MYLDIAQFTVALINLAKSFSGDSIRKNELGHALQQLHFRLSAVVRNGGQILDILARHCDGETIDLDRLADLLIEQGQAFDRAKRVIDKHSIEQALAIHAPQMDTLWTLVREKENRLRLLRSRIGPEVSRREFVNPTELRSPVDIVDYPDIASVRQSQIELEKLSIQLEELRKFVANNYSVDDLR